MQLTHDIKRIGNALLISIAFSISNASAESISNKNLECRQCNILLLNLDLLRNDFIYRSDELIPNIKSFFEDGISFTDVTASSGVTAISNTATLTSKDGHFTYSLLKNTYVDEPPQMPYFYTELYKRTPTITEILKKNGFHTINVNQGWYAGKQMLLHRGFEQYFGISEVDSNDYTPGKGFDKVVELIKEHNSKKKFFLLMRSEDLRGLPYRYPANLPRITHPKVEYRKVDGSYFDIVYQPRPDGTLTTQFSPFARADWMSKDQIREYQSIAKTLYAQQLKYVDIKMGQVFEALKNKDLLKNTIVVLYSNHGDGLYDNRIPNHGVSYQSCVSVPLLIKHPKIKRPIRVNTPVSLLDLVPTVLGMANINHSINFDGLDLRGVISGNKKYSRNTFYGVDKESQFIRHKNLKLIVWADRVVELYNLDNDPNEENNISAENKKDVQKLQTLLSEREISGLDKAMRLLVEDKKSKLKPGK